MLDLHNLDDEQTHIAEVLYRARFAGIPNDCGFGKTIVGWEVYRRARKKHPNLKLVIFTTAKVARESTWEKEAKQWKQIADLKLRIVSLQHLDPSTRKRVLKGGEWDVMVGSYPTWANLMTTHQDTPCMFIADEAHRLRGEKSKWRNALMYWRRAAEHGLLLTATPSGKDGSDFWGLTLILDGGERLGRTITEFRDTFMKQVFGQRYWTFRSKVMEERARKLALELWYAAEVKPPPETEVVDIIPVYYDMTPEAREAYDSAVLALHDDPYAYQSPAIDAAKLNQAVSGFYYWNEALPFTPDDLDDLAATCSSSDQALKLFQERYYPRRVQHLHHEREEALMSLIQRCRKEHPTSPLLITYHFEEEFRRLKAMLPEAVGDNEVDNLETLWNAGKLPILLLHYQRSAEGLNLQKGPGYVMILYHSTFSFINLYQIVRRLVRRGLKKKGMIYALHARGTVDDCKQLRQTTREMTNEEILDYARKNVRQATR